VIEGTGAFNIAYGRWLYLDNTRKKTSAVLFVILLQNAAIVIFRFISQIFDNPRNGMSSIGDLGRFFKNSLMHCLAERPPKNKNIYFEPLLLMIFIFTPVCNVCTTRV
jgi:hypothetical protein